MCRYCCHFKSDDVAIGTDLKSRGNTDHVHGFGAAATHPGCRLPASGLASWPLPLPWPRHAPRAAGPALLGRPFHHIPVLVGNQRRRSRSVSLSADPQPGLRQFFSASDEVQVYSSCCANSPWLCQSGFRKSPSLGRDGDLTGNGGTNRDWYGVTACVTVRPTVVHF